MKRQTLLKATLFCIVLVLAAQVSAQQTRRGGLYGDWTVKSEFNGRAMESILSFSRDADGNQTGQWIGLWGVSDLKDITYENGQLSFTRSMQGRDGEAMTSTFKGTIAEGKLSGNVTGGRGDYALDGQRAPRTSRAVGNWEMTGKMGDQDFTATLTITADKEGALKGTWKSERGTPEISNVQYERGTLTFAMKSTNPDRQWAANFEGQVQRDGLTGALKSDMGEIPLTGTLKGTALIGTWNLDVTSDRGTRKQRLRVNADMSGLYGSMPVKMITLDGDKVSFKITMTFGERTFEMDFQGKIAEGKLTGEMTTGMGTQTIAGAKVVRTMRRRSTQ